MDTPQNSEVSEDSSVMYVAPKVDHCQTHPYERPGGHEVLLLPWQDGWRFPTVSEFEPRAVLEPWTDSTYIARVEAPFDPPGLPRRDYMWILRDFAITCSPSVYPSNVLPALHRLDRLHLLLDRIMARIEYFAISTLSVPT